MEKRWIDFNISSQKYLNMPHIAGQSLLTEKIIQMTPYLDDSDLLGNKATKIIQSTMQTMLYYARSVDPAILRVINEILTVQSKPTKGTKENQKCYYIMQQHTPVQSSAIKLS